MLSLSGNLIKTAAELPEAFQKNLQERGVSSETPLVPLKEGGNNQVFRLQGDTRDYALKRYFQHPATRGTVSTTNGFFTRCVVITAFVKFPNPAAGIQNISLDCFAFVEGGKLRSEEISREWVQQSLEFVSQQLNALRKLPDAEKVPHCFRGIL